MRKFNFLKRHSLHLTLTAFLTLFLICLQAISPKEAFPFDCIRWNLNGECVISDYAEGPDVERCLYTLDGIPYYCLQCPETIGALEWDGKVFGLANVTPTLAISETQNPGCYYEINYWCTIGGNYNYTTTHFFRAPPLIPTVNNNCKDIGCYKGCCQTNTSVGSSANYASGNLYHTQDIVKPVGTRLPISFTLSYNSLGSIGTFGGGWTHNYNMQIHHATIVNIVLTEEDGKSTSFWNDGTGIYRPPQGSADYSTIILTNGLYQLTRKDGTVYTFDSSSGKLITIVDRNSNSTTLTYTDNKLTSVTDTYGRSIGLSYDTSGKLLSVTDPASRVTHIDYDTNGFLSTVTDPAGTAWHYTYDAYGKMLTKTDPMGYVTTYTYDSQQRLTNATNQGGTKSISYGTGNIVTVTERDGGIWTYKYASAITRPLEVTAPNNAKTISNYDANGNLISRKDPNGHITTYTYDGNGNMLTMTDPLNHTTTYTYNQWGQVTSVTDPDGNVTSNTYDANGNLISITDPSGAIAHYQYDSRGNITAITDAAGRTTTMTYDQYGNLASLTDPSGSVSLFDYDIYGNITGQTDALGNTTLFEYDSVNRLTKVTDPQGNDTAYAYDANGNRTSMTDAKGNVTFYAYNHENQIIEVIDALGNPTTYTYGGTGCQSCGGGTDKLTSVTDANNHTIGYEYDLLGRITEMTDQLGYTETYTYDLNNNLTSVTDRKGQTTTYTYDALNRMTSATYADGSYTNYAYDSTGKVITITDSISGTISYTYSTANSGMPVGKVINETTPLGSISYTYDSIGRRTSMTVDGQPTVNYAYDANSRLTDVIASGAWQSLSFAFAYDALGRRTSTTLPNGLTTNYTYDNVGRLLNLEHLNPAQQILESLTYAYDPNGNRTSMDRTSVNLPKPATAFNITYNQANQMLTFDADAITYDENGNMTSFINNCGITNYTWDARNRLVGISGFSLTSASTCSPVVASFAYDALGRRIEKMVNGRTIQYLYDGKDIVQEIENSTPSVNYIRTLNIDEPLARITADGTVRYYQTDALGSVIALTDDAGVVRTTYSYDPFGNVTISGEASDNTFQYTGRENDGTGLYYYRARYYSPELQRFISEDPIGLKSGDVNFYVMVGNNPVNKIDPQGLSGTSGDWRSYPPGYPPGPKCDAYKQCCKSFLYNACMKGGNGGWSNCVRKCLLDRWHNCKYDHGFWNDHYDCWFNVCKKQ